MYKLLSIIFVCTLILGMAGASAQAEDAAMNPAEVIKAVYDAVENQDLASAGALLADDAVLVLIPPPPGTDGTFVGKEAVLGWYENLIQNNIAIEFSNAEVSGDRATITNLTWVDDLPVGPVEFDGTGIVQDGLVKTISWVITPASMAELEAAFSMGANKTLADRYMQELWIEGNLEVADELLSEDFVSYTFPPGDREVIKGAVAGYHADHPNGSFSVDEVIVTDDKIVIRGAALDVPEGAAEGAEPEPFDWWIVTMSVEDGKITDRWLHKFQCPKNS